MSALRRRAESHHAPTDIHLYTCIPSQTTSVLPVICNLSHLFPSCFSDSCDEVFSAPLLDLLRG